LEDALACIYAMPKNLDDNLERIFAELDALDFTENTIVIFFGDHGPWAARAQGVCRPPATTPAYAGVRAVLRAAALCRHAILVVECRKGVVM